jgi:6-pyruvoyltetrahydropterin/6-carboxytetrahydropterin synthase
MFVDRVEVSFDAAHRLLDYDGKCASPHGHTYRAEVFVARSQLDSLGLAIDFGDVKQPLKRWIDEQWDHAFLLNSKDDALVCALRAVPESKLYCFPARNPSAEVMAETLFYALQGPLQNSLQSVRIWEGNQYAEYLPDPAATE